MKLALASKSAVSAASAAGAAAKAKGAALEDRVARLLRADGKGGIRRNVFLRDGNGNKSEIDVAYGRWFPTYVECKAYGPDHPVPLEDVAKFAAVLQLNRMPLSRGLFVTTSTFSPRATTIGIRTVDGKQLAAWEKAVLARRQRWAFLRTFLWGIGGGAAAFTLAILTWPWIEGQVNARRLPIAEGSLAAALRELHTEAEEGWRLGRAGPGWDVPPLAEWPRAGVEVGRAAVGRVVVLLQTAIPGLAAGAGGGSTRSSAAAGTLSPSPSITDRLRGITGGSTAASSSSGGSHGGSSSGGWLQSVKSAVGLAPSPPDLQHQPVRRVGYEVGRAAATAEAAVARLRGAE